MNGSMSVRVDEYMMDRWMYRWLSEWMYVVVFVLFGKQPIKSSNRDLVYRHARYRPTQL